jgi:hypothetical protein
VASYSDRASRAIKNAAIVDPYPGRRSGPVGVAIVTSVTVSYYTIVFRNSIESRRSPDVSDYPFHHYQSVDSERSGTEGYLDSFASFTEAA